jgi:hypothetical protein
VIIYLQQTQYIIFLHHLLRDRETLVVQVRENIRSIIHPVDVVRNLCMIQQSILISHGERHRLYSSVMLLLASVRELDPAI